MDAALDSRVFTLAHERLALWQGALWGWGGTLGLPGLDFYLAPEVLWSGVMCHMPSGKVRRPQEVFVEQVRSIGFPACRCVGVPLLCFCSSIFSMDFMMIMMACVVTLMLITVVSLLVIVVVVLPPTLTADAHEDGDE